MLRFHGGDDPPAIGAGPVDGSAIAAGQQQPAPGQPGMPGHRLDQHRFVTVQQIVVFEPLHVAELFARRVRLALEPHDGGILPFLRILFRAQLGQ